MSADHSNDQCAAQGGATPYGEFTQKAREAAAYEQAARRGERDPYWTPKGTPEETIQGPTFNLLAHLARKVDALQDRRASLRNDLAAIEQDIAHVTELIRLVN